MRPVGCGHCGRQLIHYLQLFFTAFQPHFFQDAGHAGRGCQVAPNWGGRAGLIGSVALHFTPRLNRLVGRAHGWLARPARRTRWREARGCRAAQSGVRVDAFVVRIP
jgi:hypothetical protein